MGRQFNVKRRFGPLIAGLLAIALAAAPREAAGQAASVSAWDAADFRIWGFVPYWTPQTQIDGFPADQVYDHVSDVLYFSGVRPTATGGLSYDPKAAGQLASLKSHAAEHGFRFHMSMFDVSGGSVETVWNAITSNATTRATFVNNVKNLLAANNMTGFNLDWERPNTVAEWANYTQLAKDLRAALPAGTEISVDDYGYASTLWDDTPVFDAATYDQLFIMGYHYGAAWNETFAGTKLNLTGQGAAKAFKNNQLVLGIGTWGANGPSTVSLQAIVDVQPNLAFDALTYTGTVTDIRGVSQTGTWDIESRRQVREKVQLALDRNMPGVMSWTLHYDAVGKQSLHRVAHHYAVFKRQTPDLNLDGRVDAADANALADNMGSVPGWKGTSTPAQFENFYMSGNWEKGDRDGNGFVNQQDADWLAARYAALGVALPDRLPYTGAFEKFQDARGLAKRWEASRVRGQLAETGNFTQHDSGDLAYTAVGPGGSAFSSSSVTIRNQNAAEAYDSLNTQPRTMRVALSTPIDLAQHEDAYITLLVRQNTTPLLPSQLASANRTLALELLNAAGQVQYDFALLGAQQQFGIRGQADAAGQDVAAGGFAANATMLLVAKLSGNGAGGNTLKASLLPVGAFIGNFADPQFPWMLVAEGGAGFNPLITELRLTSPYEANYTVSNVWIGTEAEFFAAAAPGDFNADGQIDDADRDRWRAGYGMTSLATHWDGDADGDGDVDGADYVIWQRHAGAASPGSVALPEPAALALAVAAVGTMALSRRAVGRPQL